MPKSKLVDLSEPRRRAPCACRSAQNCSVNQMLENEGVHNDCVVMQWAGTLVTSLAFQLLAAWRNFHHRLNVPPQLDNSATYYFPDSHFSPPAYCPASSGRNECLRFHRRRFNDWRLQIVLPCELWAASNGPMCRSAHAVWGRFTDRLLVAT